MCFAMKNHTFAILISALLVFAGIAGAQEIKAGNWDLTGWHQVWADEFDGPALDAASWTAEIGDGSPQNPGWGNAEAEYYTGREENASIVGDSGRSVLKITARAEKYRSKYYTSARIKTQGKRSFQHGRIEARIKLPQGKGLWPAFWMMGESFTSVGWPACGEIDILEMRGGDDGTISGTIHYSSSSGAHGSAIPGVARLPEGAFADEYHLFGVEWNLKQIVWYLDGKPFFGQDISGIEKKELAEGRYFLLLNLAVGGRFLGNQIPPIGFTEQSMYVDWVRWFQKD